MTSAARPHTFFFFFPFNARSKSATNAIHRSNAIQGNIDTNVPSYFILEFSAIWNWQTISSDVFALFWCTNEVNFFSKDSCVGHNLCVCHICMLMTESFLPTWPLKAELVDSVFIRSKLTIIYRSLYAGKQRGTRCVRWALHVEAGM